MRLAIVTAHAGAACATECIASWGKDVSVFVMDGSQGMMEAYQRGLENAADFDVVAYFHDDFVMKDPRWLAKVTREFDDPQVGLVGFGGAIRHGSPELYRSPYRLQQLGRSGYRSNVDDAEVHGERFTGACDVAVLDGFALIFRREVLVKAKGWPLHTAVGYINYDYWACCMTRRLGYRIRLLGLRCHHIGGQTLIGVLKHRDTGEHVAAHEWIYREFKDVLPFEAP